MKSPIPKYRLCYDEINSEDMYHWRYHMRKLNGDLAKFCANHNFTFVRNIESSINSQQTSEVLVARRSDLLMPEVYYQDLNDLCKRNNKTLAVVTENYVEWEPMSNVKILFDKRIYGFYASYNNDDFGSVAPSRRYNCLIQRGDPLRQSFLYWLYHHRLLDQGYVSYLLVTGVKNPQDILQPATIFQFIHNGDDSVYQYRPPHLLQLALPNNSDAIYNDLLSKVPYQNFVEQHNLVPIMQDSKYSLAIDTFAADDNRNCWCFTEKVFRPLQFSTIPLLFVQKDGISKLADWGFAMPDFYKEFDSLPLVQRQMAVLEIIKQDAIHIDHTTLTEYAQHNRDLVTKWQDDLQKEQFWQELFVDFC